MSFDLKKVGVWCVAFGVMALVFSAQASAWLNLDAEHYVGGRKCSVGYLTGKIVMICRDPEQAGRMEEVWTSFKMKPFVLIGAFGVMPQGVTYPVYRDVEYSKTGEPSADPSSLPSLHVIDPVHKRGIWMKDDRRATELVVTFLTDMESPKSVADWKKFIDYELEHLPGHAYVRLTKFKKKYPKDAREYDAQFSALGKIPKIKDLATLVAFAKAVKDCRTFDPKKEKVAKARLAAKINDALSKYAALKESGDARVVQEAKNALADLAWAKTEIE